MSPTIYWKSMTNMQRYLAPACLNIAVLVGILMNAVPYNSHLSGTEIKSDLGTAMRCECGYDFASGTTQETQRAGGNSRESRASACQSSHAG